MTTVLDKRQKSPKAPKTEPQQPWASMPGWGIAVNLLPPEVLAARRVRTLRKVVAAVLVTVVLLAAGGYAYEFWQVRTASSTLAAAQAQTADLESQQVKYAPVVALQAETAHVKQELQTLQVGDVDLSPLVHQILRVNPNPNGVTKIELDVTAASAQSATSAVPSTNGMLDTSGRAHIGSVTVTGVVRTVDEVAAYVDHLAAIPGVVEVIPTSQQVSTTGMQYSITMTLTDQLLAAPTAPALTTTGG